MNRVFCREPCMACNWFAFNRNGASRASSLVRKEINEGRMLKANAYRCMDCGKPAEQYDHRDYGKPLEVEPVCRSCNLRRGPAKSAWYILPHDGPHAKRIYGLALASGIQHAGYSQWRAQQARA